ncbi:MAG: S1C family serine protease [Pirellulales bacterium]|nr:S1C family serine protease [Pirellulales bacterium]
MASSMHQRSRQTFPLAIVCGLLMTLGIARPVSADDVSNLIEQVQPKMVKIFGWGGGPRLEDYQSGFLVSGEGHILTAWSYVLDTGTVTVHMFDGIKYEAKLVNIDPVAEIAVLKIEAGGNLPHFALNEESDVQPATSVWAFSNLYKVATGNEPVSVQQGVISAITNLSARRGVFNTPYQGRVYVLDAVTNNPGAAGGALVDREGRLLGMLGKEMKNDRTNSWLNYALPTSEIHDTVMQIIEDPNYTPVRVDPLAGRHGKEGKAERPMTLQRLGIVVVPEVISAATPPFVDDIRYQSPAEKAGLLRDDLIMFLNGQVIHSCQMLRAELEYIDQDDAVSLTVIRETGGVQRIVDLTLFPDF